jgi:hypothetical protein
VAVLMKENRTDDQSLKNGKTYKILDEVLMEEGIEGNSDFWFNTLNLNSFHESTQVSNSNLLGKQFV